MTRLTDGKKIAEITMQAWNKRSQRYEPDWSNDFFDIGSLPYDDSVDAYQVENVDYCIYTAHAWENHEWDGDRDYPTKEERMVFLDVTKITQLYENEQGIGNLYDGGWRSGDHDDLMEEYGFTLEEADFVCKELGRIDDANIQ